MTYGCILGRFGLAALERHSVTLVLETLGGDETLDAGCLGVGFLAFALGLDFAADDELADLGSSHPNDQHQFKTPPVPQRNQRSPQVGRHGTRAQ